MRVGWRVAVGGTVGVAASIVWALGLAIYQPFMEPSGVFTMPNGQSYPHLAENSTYWPREIRQLAILLAFAALVLLVDASARGVTIGLAGAVAWLGADLWLDRIDISGAPAAALLAIAGAAGFALASAVAVRLSAGRPGRDFVRYLVAGTAAALTAPTLLITGPWRQGYTVAEGRVELALTLLKATIVVLLAVTAIGLVAEPLTAARRWRVAVFTLLAVVVGAAALASDVFERGPRGVVAVICLVIAPVLAVNAARDLPVGLLLFTPFILTAALFFAGFWIISAGVPVAEAMTRLAGNPPVHAADTDFSLAAPGLAFAVLLATASNLTAGMLGRVVRMARRPMEIIAPS